MHRFAIPLIVLAAAAMVLPGPALAQTAEFELPPVRLKPDRPTETKPIPPTPDDREAEPSEEEAEPSEEEAEPSEEEAEPSEEEAEPSEEEAEPSEKEVEQPEKAPPVKEAGEGGEGEKSAPEAPEAEKAKPSKEVPLKPETHEEGEPPTPADLPMPEATGEPPGTGPKTIALPEDEGPPPVPEAPPGEESEPRPTDVQAEAVEAQVTPTVEPDLTGMGEVGHVEAVAAARKQYRRTLEALREYYGNRGNNTKIEWVDSELQGFEKTPKPRYLLAAEIAGPDLQPTKHIEAADQLYQEGLDYKNYPAFPPGKKGYLKIALEKFRTVIEKYPQSNQIDDAAFRMGEIYGGWYFQDYARAVQSYERCWQWDPETKHPARFKAAKIFEEKLKNRAKAVELYNEVIAHTDNEDLARQAQERIRTLTGR